MGQNNVWQMSVRLSVRPSVRLSVRPSHLISETVRAGRVPFGMHTPYGPGEVYKKNISCLFTFVYNFSADAVSLSLEVGS